MNDLLDEAEAEFASLAVQHKVIGPDGVFNRGHWRGRWFIVVPPRASLYSGGKDIQVDHKEMAGRPPGYWIFRDINRGVIDKQLAAIRACGTGPGLLSSARVVGTVARVAVSDSSVVEPVRLREHIASLNQSQHAAAVMALGPCPLTVVQAGPGTGKTTLSAVLVDSLVKAGWRVIVAAPSFVAAKVLAVKVQSYGIGVAIVAPNEEESAPRRQVMHADVGACTLDSMHRFKSGRRVNAIVIDERPWLRSCSCSPRCTPWGKPPVAFASGTNTNWRRSGNQRCFRERWSSLGSSLLW